MAEEEIKKEEPKKDDALLLIERAEKANAEMRELLNKQAEFAAKGILGGQTLAGLQLEKPKEETPAEYAKRIMRGR